MDIETNLGFLIQNITTPGPTFQSFRSGILETFGDDCLYSSQYFFRVRKHHIFGNKLSGTLALGLSSATLRASHEPGCKA